MGTFLSLLDYKLSQTGGRLVRGSPHYTSQTCSACGHAENADANAARNFSGLGKPAAPVRRRIPPNRRPDLSGPSIYPRLQEGRGQEGVPFLHGGKDVKRSRFDRDAHQETDGSGEFGEESHGERGRADLPFPPNKTKKQDQKPPIPLNIENWIFSNRTKRSTGVIIIIEKVNQTFDIELSMAFLHHFWKGGYS
ncbi:MAG: zinc ribbon domain-containing protein [Leptospirales bacterium]